jgi:hypothetical protein
LRFAGGGQLLLGLQFENDAAFHEEVGYVFSDQVAFVADLDRRLNFGFQASERQLSYQGAFVDFFQEAGAEVAVDFVDCALDLVDQIFV